MCTTCHNYHGKRCKTCGNIALDFRTPAARREYQVSGMCQDCQDNMFDGMGITDTAEVGVAG